VVVVAGAGVVEFGALLRRRPRIGAAIALLLTACGVPGLPRPPGPVPPAAPSAPEVLSAPEGLEVRVAPPLTDAEGEPLAGPVEVLLFVDRPACAGVPDAHGPGDAPLVLPPPPGPVTLRATAAREGRAGPPSPPVTAAWRRPPPPPEAPLAFADARGVELSWLPPADARAVRILRDGAFLAEVPAAAALHTDTTAPPGPHRYALQAVGPDWRTAASPAAEAVVPKP
jgi:hypothetical protein